MADLPTPFRKNKGGRPKGLPKTGGRVKGATNKIHNGLLREMLINKNLHIRAVQVLEEMIDPPEGKEPAEDKIRILAVKEILNRCFGKVQDEQANLDRQRMLEQIATQPQQARFQITFVRMDEPIPVEYENVSGD